MTSSVIRALTAGDAAFAFERAASHRAAQPAFIRQDVIILQAIAEVLAGAVRQVAELFGGLDTARRTTDRTGAAARAEPFDPSQADEYALVEALFWDRLSAEAETLLKVSLKAALSEVRP